MFQKEVLDSAEGIIVGEDLGVEVPAVDPPKVMIPHEEVIVENEQGVLGGKGTEDVGVPSKSDPMSVVTEEQHSAGLEDAPAKLDDGPVEDSSIEDSPVEDSEEEDQSEMPKIPEKVAVRWSDYEHFKNLYNSQEEGLAIIEVLYGHPDLANEIALENIRRKSSNRYIASRVKPEVKSRWIHRVRIRSSAVIHLLARLTSTTSVTVNWATETSKPRVFCRPFSTLYYTLPLVKRCFEMLQALVAYEQSHDGDVVQAPDLYDLQSSMLANKTALPVDGVQESKDTEGTPTIIMPSLANMQETVYGIEDPVTALQHVQKYVEFVEEHIVPLWDEAATCSSKKTMVRFSDLPMYFRPGDLLFVSNESAKCSDNSKYGKRHAVQNFYRFSHLVPSDMTYQYDQEPIDYLKCGREYKIFVYHIDFDGDTYGPLSGWYWIKDYEGEKDIRSLEIYPARFEKDLVRMKSELSERGQRFLSILRKRHLYYEGWSISFHAFDQGTRTDTEHIEGDIIIDFKEGYQTAPDMRKDNWISIVDEPTDTPEDNEGLGPETYYWEDSTRTKSCGADRDSVQIRENISFHLFRAFRELDSWLKAYAAEEPWLKAREADLSSHFSEEDLVLLPQRLIAYSFRARKFFEANVDCITSVPTPKNTFRDLKIKDSHKNLVRSLVRAHFHKQQMRRSANAVNLDQDFIRGKGAGLVILLHGVPGVGKTTTAEAVALSNRKPLFALTSGDLGSTPAAVEQALKETFRLAQLWDCVLLLDEADLFLSRREVEDLERNSLVSVFLRVMEYYNGVLFLTTNRVGTIDEAFKSRIHLSIYYPPLDWKQTREIFEVNIRRLREIEAAKLGAQAELDQNNPIHHTAVEIEDRRILHFAKKHFESHREPERWNGRQIRNAFQVAYSLAQSTAHEDDTEDETDVHTNKNGAPVATRLVLDDEQFEVVSQSIERFDNYLSRTRGRDSDRNREFNVRNDRYRDPEDEDLEQHPGYSRRGPDTRSGASRPRPSVRPSMHGGIEMDQDDDDREAPQQRSTKRQPASRYSSGGRGPARPSQPSALLTPGTPLSRMTRDSEYDEQEISDGEHYTDDDLGYQSRGGSISGARIRSPGLSPATPRHRRGYA
ncbi:hypothetical protein VPNG_08867 [Cytospora leucostoma]|uniref:AAA+ ATPase domain-containing protein n=1 Tax=Cytospora leucostoma TaxID=1230097 RepID=A0A423VRI8_9PEZI|nr:hypothetical protein VPNG_08867 [Cytospora leucostoma]